MISAHILRPSPNRYDFDSTEADSTQVLMHRVAEVLPLLDIWTAIVIFPGSIEEFKQRWIESDQFLDAQQVTKLTVVPDDPSASPSGAPATAQVPHLEPLEPWMPPQTSVEAGEQRDE